MYSCSSVPSYVDTLDGGAAVDSGSLDAAKIPDAADAEVPDGAKPDTGIQTDLSRIFVTKDAFDGSFANDGSGMVSTDAIANMANATCTNAWGAAHPNDNRHFRALFWVSTNVSQFADIGSRVGGWYRVRGTATNEVQVFATAAQVSSSVPTAPVLNDELGNAVTGFVWTGGNQGAAKGTLCDLWQHNLGTVTGFGGDPTGNNDWVEWVEYNCNARGHLYCIEQDAP